ncbi:hypothetical protein EST38_g10754 [Candolleomyces aberdarensis]|uniref:F-box domain-containing protein n=1 Tax=Candolleomyces aberdarensis TaxID=2316362 RepID=A0A4Q2D910_9AGAR|nr:hypothetical protein EST38_g10754 [Candolleomyces aberdarensis]
MIDIPPEILASAFEIGVLRWGIRYLPPMCLVCKEWNQVVINTPHLWGIIEVTTNSHAEFLLDQIARAKATSLTIFVSKGVLYIHSLAPVIRGLVALSPNWIKATVPRTLLNKCRWADLRDSLLELSVTNGSEASESSLFFDGIADTRPFHPPALRHLSMDYAYVFHPEWDNYFLSPLIQTFNINGNNNEQVPLSITVDQLSKTPNVRELSIQNLHHRPFLPEKTEKSLVVYLDSLFSLEVEWVEFPSFLLSSISCRSLNSLTIGHCPRRIWRLWPTVNPSFDSSFRTLSPFLTQWCNPKFLPSSLHSLKLELCMAVADIPNLIRFLARLPNLAVLALIDNALDYQPEKHRPYTDENDILMALASPSGARSGVGGWLCPSLRVLHVEAEIDFQQLLDVVILRGCYSPEVESNNAVDSVTGPAKTLRWVIGLTCSEGTRESREQLSGLVEQVYCTCIGCCFENCAGESILLERIKCFV